ncbi:low-density lipoprotein receptor class A domain-containing protein 4 isoform X5 [Vicugna pacos]|uniref:Low-density lipoprotein receptor class A domain-containing protein 4 isoform X5 n=1 Tax=Vicugna pacos TaxID=30538 RepID=A0ABM5C9Z7_VICPA
MQEAGFPATHAFTECKFTCTSGRCLYLGSLVCNQQNDCGDNSDEENCLLVTEHPPPGIFSWLRGPCVEVLHTTELELAQVVVIVVVVTVMVVVIVCLLSHYRVSTRSFIHRPSRGRRPGDGLQPVWPLGVERGVTVRTQPIGGAQGSSFSPLNTAQQKYRFQKGLPESSTRTYTSCVSSSCDGVLRLCCQDREAQNVRQSAPAHSVLTRLSRVAGHRPTPLACLRPPESLPFVGDPEGLLRQDFLPAVQGQHGLGRPGGGRLKH